MGISKKEKQDLMKETPWYDGEGEDLDLIWSQLEIWKKRCLLAAVENLQKQVMAKAGIVIDG